MATNLEFYNSLRKYMPDEAARLIAEALPPSDLATRADVEGTRTALHTEIHEVRGEIHEVRGEIALLRGELVGMIKGVEASVYKWMLTFFATLWLGVLGMIATFIFTR